MGIISRELTDDSPLVIVEISIFSLPEQSFSVKCEALVDTGANWSWVTDELAEEAGILDTPRVPVEEFGLSPVTYNAYGSREAYMYAAGITIGDTTIRTLVYTSLRTPPNATYKALLGCAVLWFG
jgi:predicted aspartyl protease